MKKLNNRGETLVELIVATVILAICSLMLLTGFTSAMNIANRATLYKMESATTLSTIELEDEQDPSNSTYSITEFTYKDVPAGLTLTYIKDGAQKTTVVKGQFITATANSSSNDAKLTYSEFLSSNISLVVPAEDVDE